MKKQEISTSVVVGIIGLVVAYFVFSLILPAIENDSFRTLETSTDYSLQAPDDNVFNFRAVNPTVEVYVGNNGASE